MALTQTQVSQLYVSIFNRASEGNGNTYWQSGADLATVATQMLATTDAATYFGSSLDTNEAFVKRIYLNTLNKTEADDAAGIAHWVNELNTGTSRGQMVANLVTAATEAANAGAAQDQFNNRVTVSNYMADTVAAAPSDYTTSTSFSSGLTVTSDAATVTTAQAAVDDIANPGQTFSLTTGTDTFTGTAGNDTFNGALTTVGSLDSLVGGAGTDTANLEVSQDLAATFTTTDVETINFTTYGTRNVDMTKMTGVETFNVKNSTGAVTLNNVNSATMALSFEGSSTNNVAANYKAGTLAGTADKLTVELNTAAAVSVDADAGFESAEITVNGTSDIDAFTAPGVVTTVIKGAGNLDIATGLMTGIETLSASDYTGNLTTGTANATTGFASGTITGSSAGTVITLGSGTDNIGVVDASAATKSTTVKLGAGDDKILINAAGNAMYVFGEAGNDSISAATTALDSADVIDGGAGTDTLYLDNIAANNAMVLKGIENVIIKASVGGDGTAQTQTFTNDDDATAITAKVVTSDDVLLASLAAGSTVTINEATAGANPTIDKVTVGFKATEASTTLVINVAMDEDLTVSKVTALTVDFAKASTIVGDVTIDDTTSLTLTSAGALDLGTGISSAATDKLKTITATTTAGALDLGVIANSDALETLTATAAAGLTIGATNDAIDAADKLKNATLTGTTVALFSIGNADAIADLETFSVTASNGDATFTSSADNDVMINTTKAGTVTISAAKGDIYATDGATTTTLVAAADSTGITVNLTAKDYISATSNNTTSALVVSNTDGNITATLAGTAAANVNYTAAKATVTTATVNLTATNTGGLTSTITNAATAGDGSTSTISLGNAVSGASNAITVKGTVDTINITGGTGTDTVTFDSTNAIKNGTISLGSGSSDAVDFTNLVITNSKGLAMNFSSSTITFGAGYANETTLASGKVAAYDAANYAGSTTASAKAIVADGQNFTVSGAEIITGTGVADYIAVANTGMTVTGGAGADIIIGNAGVDTFILTANTDTYNDTTLFSDGGSTATFDKIYGVTNGDKINFAAVGTLADGVAVGTALLGALADEVALVQGTYDAAADTFTAGTGATDNDYMFQGAETTGAFNYGVLLIDVTGTVTMTYASEIATIAIA